MKRLLVAITLLILCCAAQAQAFDFLGWHLDWLGDGTRQAQAPSGHSGYKVSGGGYYLLGPSNTQSYIP